MTLRISTKNYVSLKSITKPHRIYGYDRIEKNAIEQFENAMSEAFAVVGSGMPDMHLGYNMPIGGVIGTTDVIVPSWVGYDIGCGVFAVKTTFDAWEVKSKSEEIFNNIYELVPTGFNRHTEANAPPDWSFKSTDWTPFLAEMYHENKGHLQLGTLGSGNHFIEIGVGWDEHVWIIVHSGSRNIGHSVATHYIKQACGLATGKLKQAEGNFGLDFFSMDPLQRALANDYETDMNFCLNFALENRRRIAILTAQAMSDIACTGAIISDTIINNNHNHAELRGTPWGDLWIHRKGATDASEKVEGVIPGNMRDGSFIVEGRGDPHSLYSSSHGAGRVGSRVDAGLKKSPLELRLAAVDVFKNQMGDIKAKITLDTLDENPMAYKPIAPVLEAQRDLCKVTNHIKPLINIKA